MSPDFKFEDVEAPTTPRSNEPYKSQCVSQGCRNEEAACKIWDQEACKILLETGFFDFWWWKSEWWSFIQWPWKLNQPPNPNAAPNVSTKLLNWLPNKPLQTPWNINTWNVNTWNVNSNNPNWKINFWNQI